MPDSRYSPSVRRRRLSALLRQLREERGMKIDDVNKSLDWSAGKLSRMERNEWKRPSVRDMEDLAGVYHLSNEMRTAVTSLAREARTRGWWVEYNDILRGSLADFEVEASMIRTYEALIVPGLLQTRDYAAAVLSAGRILTDQEIDRRTAVRMRRQQILTQDNPPHLWAIIDEAALRKNIGGDSVMRAQIEHLLDAAAWPNIDLQVVCDEAGAHTALDGSFMVLDFRHPDDRPLTYIETATEDLYIEDTAAIQRYEQIFGQLCTSTHSPEHTARYLNSLIAP